MSTNWIDLPGGMFIGGLTAAEAETLARISASISERFLEDDPDRWAFGADRAAFTDRTGNVGFLTDILTALCPQRPVTLEPYRIARSPVTVGQFTEFCRSHGIQWRPALHATPADAATGITFANAARYAQWVGARLPTIDEWEFAARGAARRLFPWGDQWTTGADVLMDVAFGAGWPPGKHSGLGTPEGCLDLLGACGEWCAGRYAPDVNAWSLLSLRPKYSLATNVSIAMGTRTAVIPNAVLAAGIAPDESGFLPGFRLACDATSLDQLYDEMGREDRARREWHLGAVPAPYDAQPMVRHLASFGKAALPRALDALRDGAPPAQDLARRVIEAMGSAAAPAAVEPLIEHARLVPVAIVALWSVSPESVEPSGLHRVHGPRQILVNHLLHGRQVELAGLLERLLDDPDSEVVRFAIAGDETRSPWERLVFHPDAPVPVGKLRQLADAGAPDLSAAALRALSLVRRPEDVGRVLAAVRAGRFTPDADDVRWLAAHPESDALQGAVVRDGRPTDLLVELVRRRRCAGLPIAVEWLRPMLRRELTSPSTAEHDLEAGWRAVEIALEVKDGALMREVGRALPRLRVRPPRTGGGMRADTDPVSHPPETLPGADAAFLTGHLEDWDPVSAFRRYALVLLQDPGSAHAAFQIAWMDRAFGSAVSAERIAWIRALGFGDEGLLSVLASPPAWTLPGARIMARPSGARVWHPSVSRVAEVGLPSLAAAMYRGAGALPDPGGAHAARLDRDARSHVERVVAACTRAS